MLGSFPNSRLRRLRVNPRIREIIRDTHIKVDDIILPLFIHHEDSAKNPIASMPGHFQLGLNNLEDEVHKIIDLGIPGVILFGIPEHKDETGSHAFHSQGVIQKAITKIKQIAPQLLVITDICLCEYTHHSHCGVLNDKNGRLDIDNDATLELLAKQALSHAQAGADIVAPSGMMDGMVKAIRHNLDTNDFHNIPILSYAIKYCSALYAPFRDIAESVLHKGDRKTYQMDYANSNEALREAALDINEGADILMVKPAHSYLDIIGKIKTAFPAIPLAAYHVSGEYAMIKAAAMQGWIDEKAVALEVLTAIKRAGANIIFTYYAKEVAKWITCHSE